jgi:hypothetical protein
MALLPLDQVREGLRGDPSIYPQNLSVPREQFLFVKLDRRALEAASFLDDRILTPESQGRWLGFGEVEAALASAPQHTPLHFIFHSGHVGSTLVSRLLDALGGVLGLREPLPLRAIAEAFDDVGAAHALVSDARAQALLTCCCKLWSRGYADTEAVVVKATSSAGRLSSQLLRARPDARAIFMTLSAEPYLATLLAGQNTHIDLRGQGAERHKRLARLGVSPSAPLHAMSLGELAAMTWLAEGLTQSSAQSEHGARLMTVDFDAFLAAPAQTMAAIASHFGLKRSGDAFAAVAESPVLRHYSKAPVRPYTAELRQEILAESRRLNGEEIRKGLAWLEQTARQSPPAASALSA